MRASYLGTCLTLACVLVLTAATADRAWAREAVVTTADGRVLTGELVSQDEATVTLLISGIKTPIPRRSIQSVEIKAEPREQYREMRSKLDDGDLDGRYRLAYTMYEKKWYDLALSELQSIEQSFPESKKVKALAIVVSGRLAQQQAQTDPPDARHSARPSATATTDQITDGDEDLRLTEEQIALIRVYEVDLDVQPRITVPAETIDKLFEKYASDDRLNKDRKAFRRLPGHEQLGILFDLQARELYGEVVIRQDSPALKAFRSQIHQRYVLNYCAATACHSNGSQDGLHLLRLQPNSDATLYTNFYVLTRYENQVGKMIDRDTPRRSLLLQYGLAREVAATPHPDTSGWRAQFVSEDDERFQQYADVLEGFWSPAPEYGINYTPAQPPPSPPESDAAQDTP